jgi:hypothetical protein
MQLLQLLSKALRPQKPVQTVSNNKITASELTNIRPSYDATRNKQESHPVPSQKSDLSRIAPSMGTTSRPMQKENNSNVKLHGLPDSGRQNTHMKTLKPTEGTVIAGIGYENTNGNKVLQTPGTNKPNPSKPPSTNEVDFNHGTEQTNAGVMGAQALHTGNNMGMYNSAQLYTNPLSMLAAGMGSTGDGSMGNTASMINSGIQAPYTKETPGFDPNRLMSSWTNTNVFNPEKYNVGQNFISTDEWTSYANQPTGYNGLMSTLNQKPKESDKKNDQTIMSNQNGVNTPIKPSQSHGSIQGMVQGSALTAKMNFVPNNMILPMSNPQMPKMNIKFTFDPDSLNSFKGTFHPGQFAPLSASNANEAHSPKFDADAVNQHLLGYAKDVPSRQKHPIHAGKDANHQMNFAAIPKYNADSFNTASMNFSPDRFLGPLSQYFNKGPRHGTNKGPVGKSPSKSSIAKRDLQNDIKEDENASLRNISTHNVTVPQTTGASSTTDRTTGFTTTPDVQTTTSLESIGGFNPDEANRPIMYNPGMSPGMSFGSFQNFQYNSQQQSVESNSTGGQMGFTNIGFNPSEVNNAKMSFDVNTQLGIGGGSSNFNGQAFSGGYDPVKTNFLAIQNPFSSTNDSKGSFTAGAVSGFQSAFVGSFNPNTVNQGMMQNLLNSQSKDNSSGSGNYFGMSMNGFDISGYGGNFDPSSVNNAVFNPNEVNKVKMHFDPSAMLERNPGYDTDKALAYKFDPSNINSMQMNFQPPYLQNNKQQGSGNKTVSFKPKLDNGANFVPGLLGGGGNNGIPMFNPAAVNNAHMNFAPIGIDNLPTNPANITLGSNTTDSPKDTSTLFNPNSVNDAKMNFQPDRNVNPGSLRKAVPLGSSFTPGLLTGGKIMPESNKEKRGETIQGSY